MKIEYLKTLPSHQRHSVYLLLCLCSINVGIVVLALLNMALKLNYPFFDLEHDGGLAECFQYGEEVAVAVLLLGVALRRKQSGLLIWGLLFLYLFIDDAFSIHESVGLQLANVFEFSTNRLRPQDIGEMIVSATIGLVFFISLGLNSLSKRSVAYRAITCDLIFLLGIIVFFGVFVDMLHVAFGKAWWMYVIFSIIEEAGELFSFSLIVTYVYQLARSKAGESVLLVQPIAQRLYSAWRVTRPA